VHAHKCQVHDAGKNLVLVAVRKSKKHLILIVVTHHGGRR
jgi:hypothetical protein